MRDAQDLGYGAVTGDARFAEVLEHAGLTAASFVVVAVPAVDATLQLVRAVRRQAPNAVVLARARFHRSLPELQAAGAHVIIDEEHEVGRQIARAYEELGRAAGN